MTLSEYMNEIDEIMDQHNNNEDESIASSIATLNTALSRISRSSNSTNNTIVTTLFRDAQELDLSNTNGRNELMLAPLASIFNDRGLDGDDALQTLANACASSATALRALVGQTCLSNSASRSGSNNSSQYNSSEDSNMSVTSAMTEEAFIACNVLVQLGSAAEAGTRFLLDELEELQDILAAHTQPMVGEEKNDDDYQRAEDANEEKKMESGGRRRKSFLKTRNKRVIKNRTNKKKKRIKRTKKGGRGKKRSNKARTNKRRK